MAGSATPSKSYNWLRSGVELWLDVLLWQKRRRSPENDPGTEDVEISLFCITRGYLAEIIDFFEAVDESLKGSGWWLNPTPLKNMSY